MLTQIKIYVALGALAVVAGLVAAVLWYRGEWIEASAGERAAKADLATALAVNKAQDATIGRLRANAEANDRIVAQLAEQLAAINVAVTDTNKQIGNLKDANEDVRAFLAGRVPPELERLLNK